MLGPEQGYDGMYGQGPPSVHSSHGGRGYQPQGKEFFHFIFFFFFHYFVYKFHCKFIIKYTILT